MILSSAWVSRLAGLALLAGCPAAGADELRLAVAANFKPTLEVMARQYRQETGRAVSLSAGSTGALYAQIRHGAPFDIFFAADVLRPQKLESENLTRLRATYACGRLVFWVPGRAPVTRSSLTAFRQPIAIANPRHAPYGEAAMQLLANLGMTGNRLLRGVSLGQAFAFVQTGNAPAGLVALSQVVYTSADPGHYWLVPETLHEPIEQQLVVMKAAAAASEAFLDYLGGDAATRQIRAAGYRTPAP